MAQYHQQHVSLWLLPCPLLPRMHLARSCLNSLQEPYDPMVFLHTICDHLYELFEPINCHLNYVLF
jgi:hypothetical protein